MKPQFTEEEAHDFCVDMQFSNVLTVKQVMREKGYIRKSDLEILIEEAEDCYRSWHIKWGITDLSDLCNKLHDAFTAMKAELNKRRDI